MLRNFFVRLLAALLLLGCAPLPALARQDTLTAVDQWQAVLAGERATLEQQIDGGISAYTVDVEFVPADADHFARIEGEQEIVWINPAAEPAGEIYLRLYSNDERYREGSIEVGNVAIDGLPAEPILSVDDTVLTIPLDVPILPGETATLTLTFVATIPKNVLSSFGMFNHDTASDSYTLDHWMPLLAGYDPANGYELAPLSINGDPVFSNVAFFTVVLTAPEELVIASTGVIEDETVRGGVKTTHFVSGPVRNFTMAISAHYGVAEGWAGETLVRSYYLPGHQERGEAALRWSIDSLLLFNDLLGPYPYAQFSVVDAVVGGGAAGIEFPQIVYLASSYYREPLNNERFPRGHEFTLVHEVLHQWWYAVVGNNQHRHAFLDESLTNYLTVVYFEQIYGEEVAQQQALLNIVAPYLIFLYGMSGGPRDDEILNTPTDDFSSDLAYGVIVYNKGPIAFQAFREAMGDEPFFAALRAYYAEQALLIAQPDDLRGALIAAAPENVDLAALWEHWIEQANGKDDFPPELAVEIIGALRSR